ncbi:hypothetical protein CIPAW_01G071400 [Carya illinoinensis]|uniref:Retrovirus-related Pol polyprotein from transposon TNT 1-94-like beta-barrel domain-containing protein n=1 Tax=Carya illinoinensis TaxID=32201 RepID=A0A8T1RIW8_CARIL|nr:hypothetical protein CIPAW_01G071400 [Carya illinoinensis]
MKLEEPKQAFWHPDTRATDHMIANQGTLQSVTPYTGHDGIMVGNGKSLPITHTGQVMIRFAQSKIQLNNVLMVPDIKKDLLSVSRLTSDYPLKFGFDGNGFVIKDRMTLRTVAIGRNRKGLYVFNAAAWTFPEKRTTFPLKFEQQIKRVGT